MARSNWLFGCEELDDSVPAAAAEAAPAAATEAEPAVVEDAGESVEAQLIEVEGLDAEICTMEADAGELQGDTESMENMESAVAESAEEGGLDETAAKVTEVAMESYCARWGIQRTRVATESFAGGSRQQATQVALEGIGDSIKGAFEAFGKWLQELVNKIRDFWVKYINAGKAVKKRAQKLKQRLSNGLGAIKKDHISGAWAKDLLINQKVDIATVLKFLSGADKGIGGFGKKIEDAVSLIKFGGDKVFKRMEYNTVLISLIYAVNGMYYPGVIGISELRGAGRVPSNAKDLEIYATPGEGYFVSFTNPDDGRKSVKFAQHSTDGKLANVDIKTPSTSDLDKAVEGLIQCGDIMETKIISFRDGQMKLAQLNGEVKAAIAAVDKATSREDIQTARKNVWAAKDALEQYNTVTRVITNSLTTVSKGLIGYITAGIGAYAAVKDAVEHDQVQVI